MLTSAEFLEQLAIFNIPVGGGGGSGTVTSITAGAGLAGGTITTSGTISLGVPVVATDGGTGLTSFAINSLLYASAADTWATLSTSNNAVLITGASGIPALSTTLPAGLTIPGYLALTGGTMSGALSMGANQINNLASPSAGTDGANKAYVDMSVAGLGPAGPVTAATTANFSATYDNGTAGVGATLTATAVGAVTFDGEAVVLNSSYLFKNQSDSTQNGIYDNTTLGTIATAAVFTRSTSYDTPTSINDTGIVPVINGSTQAGQGFYQTNVIDTIGTSDLNYIVFGGSGTVTSITAGTGLSGGTITGVGTIALSVPVAVTNGGTGLTSTTTNAILYSTGSSVIGQISPTDSAVLVSSSGGVPSMSTILPSGLTIPGYAGSGANSNITSMTGLTGYLEAPTGIKDSSGNVVVLFATGSVSDFLVLSQSKISTNAGNLILDPASGSVFLQAPGGISSSLYWDCSDGYQLSLTPSSSQSEDINFVFPPSLPTVSGQALVSDTSGNMSFQRAVNASYTPSVGTSLTGGGVNTKITYDTQIFENGGSYMSGSRYTPQVAGMYLVTASNFLSSTDVGNVAGLSIYLNGSEYKQSGIGIMGASNFGMAVTGLVPCNGTTDYIEIWAYNQGSAAVTTGLTASQAYFDVTRISS